MSQITVDELFARIGRLTIQNELLQARVAQLEVELKDVRAIPKAEKKNGVPT